jgi:arsenate reductase (glutaredoxin)
MRCIVAVVPSISRGVMHNAYMIKVYGIPNCDTVKKARAWLTEQGLDYTFHDFKKQGVPEAELGHWIEAVGLDRVVNRKGTTWRQLTPNEQAALGQLDLARAVLMEHASVIKRPVLVWPQGGVTVGFDAASWASLR